jgi:hypothetical protein
LAAHFRKPLVVAPAANGVGVADELYLVLVQ